MNIDVVALLRELDIDIAEGTTSRSWLLRLPTGKSFLVEPSVPVDRISAHTIRSISFDRTSPIRPLVIGRTITSNMLEHAKSGQFDVLTENPLGLVLQGSVHEVSDSLQSSTQRNVSRRPAWIRWAVIRCLLLSSGPLRQRMIADMLGTSQQSVSNAASQLGCLVEDRGEGLSAINKEKLLEHWVEEYIGPGGEEFGWYSLKPIVDQTLNAAKVVELFDSKPLISGDVAADRLAPWKLPSRGRIYISRPVDLGGDGFVPAPIKDATLITCIPRDPTLWRLTHDTPFQDSEASTLADAAIVYWDILASGDIDSAESANHLKKLITRSNY